MAGSRLLEGQQEVYGGNCSWHDSMSSCLTMTDYVCRVMEKQIFGHFIPAHCQQFVHSTYLVFVFLRVVPRRLALA